MDHHQKTLIPLGHRVHMTEAAHELLHLLGCDDWHVACHQEHQFVVHLTHGGQKRYALCFECSPPVQKGVYHDAVATSLTIIPLADSPELGPELVQTIKAKLAELETAHV